MRILQPYLFPCFLFLTLLLSASLRAEEAQSRLSSCLRAWGKHPFGKTPEYKTIGTSVNVFGIGENTADLMYTQSPSLVLVNPGINIMGGTTIELLNPHGWYCFLGNVNVMGSLKIRAHCKAHLAFAGDGVTVLGSGSADHAVTVMGSTQVDMVGCP